VEDPELVTFRNAADRLARTATGSLKGAPPAGVRGESDLQQIRMAQLALLHPEERALLVWALDEATRLLTQPDERLIDSLAVQMGLTQMDVSQRGVSVANVGGLANVLLLPLKQVVRPGLKIDFPRTVMLEPLPRVFVAMRFANLPGALVGLPLSVVTRDELGRYHASRIWLTLLIGGSDAASWKVLRWLPRGV
jgi:hypothetical protein